ncbi:hypothetical protein [Clostridium sp.]|uniref:hypothetical protein n=1 Tax=Clostridium sp. TaxID=1506 RepID=UPI002850A147|nr:hypothetical protein [Clostridium sp.]MDR3596381.1 hypothetical protein [Clostridium sp.]
MGKPSIFSREYEKKMKKRRTSIIIISFAILLVISALIVKVICNPIDYKNIKNNIQAWIDSDTANIGEKKQVTDEDVNNSEEAPKEEVKKPVEEYLTITLASGNVAKAIYADDIKNEKAFKTLDSNDKGVGFDISPSGKQMIVIDTNSEITLYNVDGTSKVVSKERYVSTSGGVFTKEATIQSNQAYLWNVNPKFISDDKIIFVTNRPYFGNGNLKQYLWMTDITNDADKIFWELAGQDIEIGTKEEKGVKVTVDGQIHYIDKDGNNIQ